MRVLVCGGRDYGDVARMYDVLGSLQNVTMVISGHARGADQMAEMWADEFNIPLKIFHADWDKHGRAAGPIRNQQMLDEGRPDLVVAFPGGRGTADMIAKARAEGIPVKQID